MIDTPQITETDARPTAVIRFTIPRHEIQTVMGPAIAEVMATIAAQGVAPVGPVFSHHFRMDPEVFDFEVGIPVSTPVTPAGRVTASELPATTVARTIYRGGYEGLGSAWGAFEKWMRDEGHAMAPGLWENYVAGPETGSDPSTWRTELNRPLASSGK